MSNDRKMPQAWFTGSASATCISEIIRKPNPDDLRPLQKGERLLGKFILPDFQRPKVWTLEQQIKLVESIWDGLPIGAYVYNEGKFGAETDQWLLDGQQRITALLDYTNDDKFSVYGYYYSELGRAEQRHFENKTFGSITTKLQTVEQCRLVYDRLAYGGTAHAPKE